MNPRDLAGNTELTQKIMNPRDLAGNTELTQKITNPRDLAGNAEEEGEVSCCLMIESKAETAPTASVSGRLEKMNSIRMRRGEERA